ncbi:MAG: polysaccharide pyruvyl transferase WcaK-like protein [Desulforhopalus sp.]|jgi:polysaccharide pyruvyl transferase WcaK-like protein
MKIGLLTCHSCLNYGANLQLFATVKSLEKMGHDIYAYDNRDHEASRCRDFVEKHVQLTKPCRTDDEFRQETIRLGIEVILVGSDAVLWLLPGKREGHGAYPNPFWLSWARDLPVRKALISASSMGVMFPKLSRKLRIALKKDLESFDYISVRDKWTLYFMMWLSIRGTDLTFDPTSALPDLVDFKSRSLPNGLNPKKYILFTFSNVNEADSWLADATAIAHTKGIKTCFVCHPDHLCSVKNVDVCISNVMDPLDWLTLLSNAAGYVGERFHPIVLSHFFKVPYLSCDYYSEGGMRSLFNFRSKTKDFCRRIGTNRFVVPSSIFFTKESAESAMVQLEQSAARTSGVNPAHFLSSLSLAIDKNAK